jgi:acetylornithine deacetylase
MKSTLTARSFRLNSSKIEMDHPFVKAGLEIGRTTYGSPTSSDQAIIPCTSVKSVPETVGVLTPRMNLFIEEIEEGIEIYIEFWRRFYRLEDRDLSK